MAKNKAQLDAMIEPQSRSEEFLNYICGRSTDINSLPKPESRVEEYLEYIALEVGQIGGSIPNNGSSSGGVVNNTALDITYNDTNQVGKTNVQDMLDYLETDKVKARPKKSFIICVAGQSNAVGYDESPVSPYVSKNLNENRLRQLGIYDDTNLQNIPLGYHAHSFQDMRNIVNPSSQEFAGTKGIHLPLGNLLLNEVPEDYEIVFVSATYGATGFTSGNNNGYNSTTMLPNTLANQKWGATGPYYLAMRDRIKYLLDQNIDNVFGGVIWIQGEDDKNNANSHFEGFQRMTEEFFNYFNTTENGKYKTRVSKREWDKDLWYNVETVSYWYGVGECQQIWNNYKAWNPKTYVKIPRDTESNAINGTGATSSTRQSHFGNDAFTKVVAPRVVDKLKENGALFNHVFKDNIDMSGVVRSWNDLEGAYQIKPNLFDYTTMSDDNTGYNGNVINTNLPQWKLTKIPCIAGESYTIVLNNLNTSTGCVTSSTSDTVLSKINYIKSQSNGKEIFVADIPADLNQTDLLLRININKDFQGEEESMMVFEGNVADDIPTQYIPYTKGIDKFIDSSKIKTFFDNSDTNLTSLYIDDAIKEINNKMPVEDAFAKNDVNNVFIGENTFKDIFIYKNWNSIKSVDYKTGGSESAYNGIRWTGTRNVSTARLSDNYVSKIRIYVDSRTSNPVNGLEIIPVTKKTDKTQDIVHEKLELKSEYEIININNTYYIEIDINKEFEDDTYFIIGNTVTGDAGRLRSAGDFDGADKINVTTRPSVGVGVADNSSSLNYVTKYEIFGRENLIKSLLQNIIIDMKVGTSSNTLVLTRVDGTTKTLDLTTPNNNPNWL